MMITEETQQILCNLFITLAKGERGIKITRQVLSNSFNFSPYTIFCYLSNLKSKLIDSNDIYNYLSSKNIIISEIESKLILLFYDKNFDNTLTYDEFCYFILNEKNKNNNSNFILSKKSSLDSNIEFLLLKLFKKEIELAKKLLIYLKKLRIRQDFNIHKVFHYISNMNFINKFCLEKFFEKNSNDYLGSDIKNIIRRMDINKDGVIDLREFYAILEYPKSADNYYRFIPCNICREKYCDKCLYKNNSNSNILIQSEDKFNDNYPLSPNISNNYNLHSIKYFRNGNNSLLNSNDLIKSQPESNIKSYLDNNINRNCKTQRYQNIYGNNFEENKRANSPLIFTLRSKISLLKNIKKMEENPYCQIYPKNYLNRNLKSYYANILGSCFNSNSIDNDIKKFNNFLLLIMQKEVEIEKEKINFILNINLNFENIFEFFDKDNKGYITIQDLKNGLDILKINKNENEINLFMNRYDLTKNKKINKLDFFDVVVPFQKEYRIIMENKSLYTIEKDSKDTLFNNKNNISYLRKLFIFLIDKEIEINKIKTKFYDLKTKLNLLFSLIDKDNKGYFSFNEFTSYLEKNKLEYDTFGVALLFIKLDKNRKGKIGILEMGEEMRPFYL